MDRWQACAASSKAQLDTPASAWMQFMDHGEHLGSHMGCTGLKIWEKEGRACMYTTFGDIFKKNLETCTRIESKLLVWLDREDAPAPGVQQATIQFPPIAEL